jgi:hypothetical protein
MLYISPIELDEVKIIFFIVLHVLHGFPFHVTYHVLFCRIETSNFFGSKLLITRIEPNISSLHNIIITDSLISTNL